MDDEFWDRLLEQIENGEVVPVVGPGAVTFGAGDELLYPWLAQRLPGDLVPPLTEIEAVPPILSLLCRELNERRFALGAAGGAPAAQVEFQEGDAAIETIIAAFYERCLAGRPEAVRMFIEEELIGYSGARLAQDERSILATFENGYEFDRAGHGKNVPGFGEARAARACLSELVNQRLLSALPGGRYELIHDLVAQVVERSRAARREETERQRTERAALEAREAE